MSSVLVLLFLFFVSSVFSHDHNETDTHDDNHDSHTCHYGVVPFINIPLAEDECSYLKFDLCILGTCAEVERSFIFECNSESEGEARLYNNTDCSGNPYNTTILTNTDKFDCSSTDECDIIISDFMYYNETECSGNIVSMASYAFSSGMTCVKTGDDTYIGFSYDETDDELIEYTYDSSDCDTPVNTTVLQSGCTGNYTMWSFEIEEASSSSDTSDSSASADTSNSDTYNTTSNSTDTDTKSDSDAAFGLTQNNNNILFVVIFGLFFVVYSIL